MLAAPSGANDPMDYRLPHPAWTACTHAVRLSLLDADSERLHRFLDLLLEANQRMNLTRITERDAAEVQHIADALSLLPHLPQASDAGPGAFEVANGASDAGPATGERPGRAEGAFRLADVGSGGGVPGIPLAIVRPDLHVTLIESTQKKAAFLRYAVGELGLGNVEVFAGRAENWRGERFDVVAARAVGALEKVVDWCLPLLRPGGGCWR